MLDKDVAVFPHLATVEQTKLTLLPRLQSQPAAMTHTLSLRSDAGPIKPRCGGVLTLLLSRLPRPATVIHSYLLATVGETLATS